MSNFELPSAVGFEYSVAHIGRMAVIVILILASLGVAGLFLAGFIWAVRSGQYEDTCTPALRILAHDEPAPVPKPAAVPARPNLNRS